MYYLLEDNRILDSKKLEKDLSNGTPLAPEFDISKERNEIHFYFLGIHLEALKIKKQSKNVWDLIENGDLLKIKQPKEAGEKYYLSEYKEPKETNYASYIKECYPKRIIVIYKPNSKGDYIKVWEKKDDKQKKG